MGIIKRIGLVMYYTVSCVILILATIIKPLYGAAYLLYMAERAGKFFQNNEPNEKELFKCPDCGESMSLEKLAKYKGCPGCGNLFKDVKAELINGSKEESTVRETDS